MKDTVPAENLAPRKEVEVSRRLALKSILAPEKIASLKSTSPSENAAPRNVTSPSANVAPLKSTLTPENFVSLKSMHVDAGLPQVGGGGIVSEAGQGMDGAGADGLGLFAELGDGLGEAFRVQASVFAQGSGLVNALTPIAVDQGEQGSGARDHAEGDLHKAEQLPGPEVLLGCQPLDAEQLPPGVERHGGGEDRGGEGQKKHSVDRPQPRAALLFRLAASATPPRTRAALLSRPTLGQTCCHRTTTTSFASDRVTTRRTRRPFPGMPHGSTSRWPNPRRRTTPAEPPAAAPPRSDGGSPSARS
ncbi:hypothetical protein [Streptomyces sp. NPDC054961]